MTVTSGRDPFPANSPQVRDLSLNGAINILNELAKEARDLSLNGAINILNELAKEAKKKRNRENKTGIRYKPFFSKDELHQLESAYWSFRYYSGNWDAQ